MYLCSNIKLGADSGHRSGYTFCDLSSGTAVLIAWALISVIFDSRGGSFARNLS